MLLRVTNEPSMDAARERITKAQRALERAVSELVEAKLAGREEVKRLAGLGMQNATGRDV